MAPFNKSSATLQGFARYLIKDDNVSISVVHNRFFFLLSIVGKD